MKNSDRVSLSSGEEGDKKEWNIPYPKRPFFGINQQEYDVFRNDILENMVTKVKRARRK